MISGTEAASGAELHSLTGRTVPCRIHSAVCSVSAAGGVKERATRLYFERSGGGYPRRRAIRQGGQGERGPVNDLTGYATRRITRQAGQALIVGGSGSFLPAPGRSSAHFEHASIVWLVFPWCCQAIRRRVISLAGQWRPGARRHLPFNR